jgi:phosphoribosylformylglycinamidine cyclo-ligase
MSEKKPITYRDAGVDIDAATDALSGSKAKIQATHGPDCLSGVGSFGGLYRVPVEAYQEPVLVSSADGVGTKVMVARMAGRHDTVGQDLVNHCVNDILVQGAKPLYFLDYFGTGRVDGSVFAEIVTGLTKACAENGMALLGGETAEMPGVYRTEDYDLVGTIVGIVERKKVIDGSAVEVGDVVIGLPSTGLHTNGYTLARRILLDREGLTTDSRLPELAGTLGEELLAVHRSYLNEITPLLEDDLIHSMAHITGGGLPDNIPRVIPSGTAVRINRDAWEIPPIFTVLAERGPVPEDDCYRTFNMGIGMVVIVAADVADEVVGRFRRSDCDALVIGEVTAGNRTVDLV